MENPSFMGWFSHEDLHIYHITRGFSWIFQLATWQFPLHLSPIKSAGGGGGFSQPRPGVVGPMAEVGTGNSSSKAHFFRRIYVNLGDDDDDGDGDELPFPHHTHQISSSCFEDQHRSEILTPWSHLNLSWDIWHCTIPLMMPNFQPRNANIRSSWWNISRHISIHLSILVGEVTILDGKTMFNPSISQWPPMRVKPMKSMGSARSVLSNPAGWAFCLGPSASVFPSPITKLEVSHASWFLINPY